MEKYRIDVDKMHAHQNPSVQCIHIVRVRKFTLSDAFGRSTAGVSAPEI